MMMKRRMGVCFVCYVHVGVVKGYVCDIAALGGDVVLRRTTRIMQLAAVQAAERSGSHLPFFAYNAAVAADAADAAVAVAADAGAAVAVGVGVEEAAWQNDDVNEAKQ